MFLTQATSKNNRPGNFNNQTVWLLNLAPFSSNQSHVCTCVCQPQKSKSGLLNSLLASSNKAVTSMKRFSEKMTLWSHCSHLRKYAFKFSLLKVASFMPWFALAVSMQRVGSELRLLKNTPLSVCVEITADISSSSSAVWISPGFQ